MKVLLGLTLAAALAAPLGAAARITRIVIDETVPMPAGRGPAYEQIAGSALGELDPTLTGNATIQDIGLARDSDGKVRHVATFLMLKPVETQVGSGLMWHGVLNRGRVFAMAGTERVAGDAAARAVAAGFLLDGDAAALIRAAAASQVLR